MVHKKIIRINPLNRVEGDLEISIEIRDGKVIDARASGVAFRGFERLLLRRDPMDALVFTCRVCGICSICHSTASSLALRSAFDARMPANAYYIRNIALASEVIMSHLMHFYALFMVDFTNKKYSSSKNYPGLVSRFAALEGSSYIAAMKARKDFLAFLGLFVGKWPNTLALQPGGVTKPVNASEIVRARAVLAGLSGFLEKELLDDNIESFLENDSVADLNTWLGAADHQQSDLGLFMEMAQESGLERLGKGPGRFLCCASYESPDGSTMYKSGYFDGIVNPFQQEKITEDVSHAWFVGDDHKHPFCGTTEPNAEKEGAYTWVKSPRYEGAVVEVGPYARLMINHDPLANDVARVSGVNAYTRSLMRIYEMLLLVRRIEEWIVRIDPEEPVYLPHRDAKDAQGKGFVEAARGMLGHWITIEKGKIRSYQIITPTSWNMSPRDAAGSPGAVEQALIGTTVEDEKNPVEVGHVVRSFDPCLFCSVHTLRATCLNHGRSTG
ncbi:nickel-dependent hydrogenase large subunit [candidate division WOR-3 bacterium]|nr:nickel-dependent hydrogenase large subunit [candidate division WOR-3 bacterium]